MTPITQAPLVEYVLVLAPFHFRCTGCAKLEQFEEGLFCTEDDVLLPCGLHSVYAVVPAGFGDEEASHG